MDGAGALTGHKKGFQSRSEENCSLSLREVLASSDLQSQLHTVLQEAITVMNFVKAHLLNALLFAVLCEEIQADHKSLLLHSEVKFLNG
jgi:hypothetical protein